MDLFHPGLTLGVLLSIGYASLYHLWNGQNLISLGTYVLGASTGFAVGQVIGNITQVSFLQIGQLHVVEASVVAWVALLLVRLFLISK